MPKGSQNDAKMDAKVIIFDKKSMKKSMLKLMPKKSGKLMKHRCENVFTFGYSSNRAVMKKRIFWKRRMYENHMIYAVECVSPGDL